MNDFEYKIGNINISPKLADNNIWLNIKMFSKSNELQDEIKKNLSAIGFEVK